jgi:hypothetical protein
MEAAAHLTFSCTKKLRLAAGGLVYETTTIKGRQFRKRKKLRLGWLFPTCNTARKKEKMSK